MPRGGTSTGVVRRLSDPNFLNRYFVGNGIDIGGRVDPLVAYREMFPRMAEVRTWDLNDGDAQFMEGVEDETYHFVYSSHCLEHLNDAQEGLRNWFRILKPGGHMVVVVPDEDLYEQGTFPSTFNRDHKVTFTIWKNKSWSDTSISVLGLVQTLGDEADVVKIQLLDSTFRYQLPRMDQTLTPIAESAIEFVVRKRPDEEVEKGGRLPTQTAELSDEAYWVLTGIDRRKSKPE